MVQEEHPNLPLVGNASSVCSVLVDGQSGEVPILNLVGEVDLGSAPKVYSLIWQTSDKGRHSLIVNLEKLEFMDSSGLQLLLRLREKLKAKKQNILLVSPPPHIKRLFQLTGFDQLFQFFADNDQASNFLGRREKRPKRAS